MEPFTKDILFVGLILIFGPLLLRHLRRWIVVPMNELEMAFCTLFDIGHHGNVMYCAILLAMSIHSASVWDVTLPVLLVLDVVRVVPVLNNIAMVLYDAGVQFLFVLLLFVLLAFVFTTFGFGRFGSDEFSEQAAGCENLIQCTLMSIYTGLSNKGKATPLYEWVTGYSDDGTELTFSDFKQGESRHFVERWSFDVLSIILTEIICCK